MPGDRGPSEIWSCRKEGNDGVQIRRHGLYVLELMFKEMRATNRMMMYFYTTVYFLKVDL
jgi:hypothetical protein